MLIIVGFERLERLMTPSLTTERLVFIGLSVVMIILSIAIFQRQMTKYDYQAAPYLNDRTQLESMRAAVQTIPPNEIIVVSDQATIISYFTGYKTVLPYHVRTEKELVSFMVDRKLTYLMVFENMTADGAFTNIFSDSGLSSLKSDFSQIGKYHSDNTTIHLYQLMKASSSFSSS